MLSTAIICVFILILLVFRWHITVYIARLLSRRNGALPPGPVSWPLIGALGITAQAPWETLTAWARQYGPVVSFFYGTEFTVVLSDLDSIRTAMKHPAFAGRPLNHSSKEFFDKGIGFAEGDMWKKHRKLVASAMRFLSGTGSQQLQFDDHLKHCGWNLVKELQDPGVDNSLDPSPTLSHTIAHVMSFLVFKDALTPSDPRFETTIKYMQIIFSVNPSTDILNTFPLLRHFPPFKTHTDQFAHANLGLLAVMRDIIKERRKSLQNVGTMEEVEPVDFTEAMFREQNLAGVYGELTDEEITVMAGEIYLAGTEDTTIVFRWIFLLLACHPDVQKKLQKNIDTVVGRTRAPTIFDRPALTYAEAVLLETLRYSSSMPFPLPHRVLEDIDYLTYKLPKDTAVIVNLYALNTSSDIWEEPNAFHPERFLDETGKLIPSRTSQVMGFGDGRRSCPGENVAKTVLLVLLATVMQSLTVKFPQGETHPEISRSNGTASQPPDYKIVVVPR